MHTKDNYNQLYFNYIPRLMFRIDKVLLCKRIQLVSWDNKWQLLIYIIMKKCWYKLATLPEDRYPISSCLIRSGILNHVEERRGNVE